MNYFSRFSTLGQGERPFQALDTGWAKRGERPLSSGLVHEDVQTSINSYVSKAYVPPESRISAAEFRWLKTASST